ncbi:MAG: hypothetical protein ACOCWY_01135, partial [Thermodesulfobacteriota bacterium]
MILLKRIRIVYGLLCFVATVASASADGRVVEQDADRDGRIDQIAHLNDSGDLVLLEIDTDRDGRMDTRQHYQKGDVVRIERDTDDRPGMDERDYRAKGRLVKREKLNRKGRIAEVMTFDDREQIREWRRDTTGDGRPDTTSFYAAGELQEVTLDTDGDGRPNTRRRYRKGQIHLEERDFDSGGRPAVVTEFAEGEPVTEKQDSDGDGAFDILIRWKKGVPVAREEDTDHDGQMDRFTEFDDRGRPVLMRESGGAAGGPVRISRFQNGTLMTVEEIFPDRSVLTRFREDQPEIQEVDEDRDGRPEQTIVFDQGAIQKETFDTNRDGQPDTWRYYEAGVLTRIEQDRNHDGTADAALIYRDGVHVRSNLDEDGDGYFETTVREDHSASGRVMEITDSKGRLLERREYTDEVMRKKEVFDAGAGLPVLVEEYGPDGGIILSREAENGSTALNLTWRYDADESAVLAEKDTDGDGRIDLWHHY